MDNACDGGLKNSTQFTASGGIDLMIKAVKISPFLTRGAQSDAVNLKKNEVAFA